MSIFSKLFGKKQTATEKEFSVNATEEGVEINSRFFAFPIPIEDLTAHIGKPNRTLNNSAVWDNLGFSGLFKEEEQIHTLRFFINIDDADKREHEPINNFSGKLTLNGEDYKTAIKITESDYLFNESAVGETAVVSVLKEESKAIEIIMLYKKAIPEKKKRSRTKKYTYQKIVGEKINFTDFNFKLAVIQELMYNQELLKPKFDVYEFAEEYSKREIDVLFEGDEPIAEVLNYFKKLEIDQKLAEHITEIHQDGGNEIYMNIAPQWDGEDETFYIQSYEDIKHFPNLKTITLFGSDRNVLEELKS